MKGQTELNPLVWIPAWLGAVLSVGMLIRNAITNRAKLSAEIDSKKFKKDDYDEGIRNFFKTIINIKNEGKFTTINRITLEIEGIDEVLEPQHYEGGGRMISVEKDNIITPFPKGYSDRFDLAFWTFKKIGDTAKCKLTVHSTYQKIELPFDIGVEKENQTQSPTKS